jgi:hypothetical protein
MHIIWAGNNPKSKALSSQVAIDGKLVSSLTKINSQTLIIHRALRMEQEIVECERHHQKDK